MFGHALMNPVWREEMETALHRLVYETENGGLSIANGEGMDGTSGLTMSDGSEMYADTSKGVTMMGGGGASSSATDTAASIKSGEYALESGHGTFDDMGMVTLVDAWHQQFDVFGIRRYAKDVRGLKLSSAHRVPQLLAKQSKGAGDSGNDKYRSSTLDIHYGYVPEVCFREPRFMYRRGMEAVADLRSEEDGSVTSGRGKVIFHRTSTPEVAIRFQNMGVSSIDTLRARTDVVSSDVMTVTYMGSDPLMPIYVYQAHIMKTGYSSAIRRLERLPMPCSGHWVVWLLGFILKQPLEAVDRLLQPHMDRIEKERLFEQINPENNDDDARFDVFLNVFEILSDVVRDSLNADLLALSVEKNVDPLALLRESDGMTMYHVIFRKHAETKRFFGGKRFCVLARYFSTRWLCSLDVSQIPTLFDVVMAVPTSVILPGKKSWLPRHMIMPSDRPQNFTNELAKRTHVPGINIASFVSIVLDMKCLKNYIAATQEAMDLGDMDDVVMHGAVPYPSGRLHGKYTFQEHWNYAASAVKRARDMRKHPKFERKCTQLCVYTTLDREYIHNNHMYLSITEIVESLRSDLQSAELATVVLEYSQMETDIMFYKERIMGAIHELADGRLPEAEHGKVLAAVISTDGQDGDMPDYDTPETQKARFQELKRASTSIRVYMRHLYRREGMFLHTMNMLAERAIEFNSAGVVIPMKRYRSMNPNARSQLERECCSEQLHALAQIASGRPVVNMVGPGGSGKTQALRVINEELGSENVLQTSFMATHKDTLVRRVGTHSRAATIHRTMYLHSLLCKSADPYKYGSRKKAMEHQMHAAQFLLKLREQYEEGEINTDLSLLCLGSQHCPFENVTTLVVEEVSVANSELLLSLIWMLFCCAPNFRLLITAGDLNQVPPIKQDAIQKALVDGFGQCRFFHIHRFADFTLRTNADGIAERSIMHVMKAKRIPVENAYALKDVDSSADADDTTAAEADDDEDDSQFDISHYSSGVFRVDSEPNNIMGKAELMIYRLQLTPDNSQFIMRTNREVDTLKRVTRNALICVAKALSHGEDPHLYAIRNYGSKKQHDKIKRAREGGYLSELELDTQLVFANMTPERMDEVQQRIYESVSTIHHGSIRINDAMWFRENFAIGQVIQVTRNMPSLQLNNLQRMQLSCCLWVRIELVNPEWDPEDEKVLDKIREYERQTSSRTSCQIRNVQSALRELRTPRAVPIPNDRTQTTLPMAPPPPPPSDTNTTLDADQLIGDRDWMMEQLRAFRSQQSELARRSRGNDIEEVRERPLDAVGMAVDSHSDGLSRALDAVCGMMQSNMSTASVNPDEMPHTRGPKKHSWLSSDAMLYLMSAVASGGVSLTQVSRLIMAECKRRYEAFPGDECDVCKMGEAGSVYLTNVPEDITRRLITECTGKAIPNSYTALIGEVSTRSLRLRVIAARRTINYDRELHQTSVPRAESMGYRLLMCREFGGEREPHKDALSWVHRGVDSTLWSAEMARSLLQDEERPDRGASRDYHLHYIPFEKKLRQLVRDGSCVTVHAMQGNQAHTIAMVTTYGSKHSHYKIVYSASTRATDRLIYLGNFKAMLKAVQTLDPPRNSSLGDLLDALVRKRLQLDIVMRPNLRTAAIVERIEDEKFGQVEYPIADDWMAHPSMRTADARVEFQRAVVEERKRRLNGDLPTVQEVEEDESDEEAMEEEEGEDDSDHSSNDEGETTEDDEEEEDEEDSDIQAQLEQDRQWMEQSNTSLSQFLKAVDTLGKHSREVAQEHGGGSTHPPSKRRKRA